MISAEPNYIVDKPASFDEENVPDGQTITESAEDTSGDLTPFQWYIRDDSADGWSTPAAPEHNRYSMNVPGWNGEEAAVPDEEYQRDITDHGMHGTHLAGIVAAAWNGSGISGIAKGAKIFGVRVFGDDGMSQSATDIVRGYEWLASVAKEVNLKAVNVSRGTVKSQLVHTIMVNKLGEEGVVTVFASGNMGDDLDGTIDLGGGKIYLYAYREGLFEGEPQLWSYTPETEQWDRVEVEGLRDEGQLVTMGEKLLYIAKLPFDEEDQKNASVFNFVDTEKGELIQADGSIREFTNMGECAFAVSGNTVYMISSEDNMEEEIVVMYLDRFVYSEEVGKFTSEELEGALTGILENRFNRACVGTPEGLVIISPLEGGKDTYFLKNSEDKLELMDHTSCYHTPFAPVEGYADGSLYVLAENATEPDVLYFRSVPVL